MEQEGNKAFRDPAVILLAKKDPVFRAALENFLCKSGYHVIPVNDAVDAINMYIHRRDSICMLIMDICVPDPDDGIELIRNIRRLDGKIPIIVATAHKKYARIDKSNKFNTSIFYKPLDFEAFHQHISKLNIDNPS